MKASTQTDQEFELYMQFLGDPIRPAYRYTYPLAGSITTIFTAPTHEKEGKVSWRLCTVDEATGIHTGALGALWGLRSPMAFLEVQF